MCVFFLEVESMHQFIKDCVALLDFWDVAHASVPVAKARELLLDLLRVMLVEQGEDSRHLRVDKDVGESHIIAGQKSLFVQAVLQSTQDACIFSENQTNLLLLL